MYCKKCGNKLSENSKFCNACGTQVDDDKSEKNETRRHETPKCTCCGYVGPWKVGPVFRKMDYVIGIIFLFLGIVPGLIYLGVVGLIRSDEKNREKTCPKCNARNLWTFFY